MFILSAKCVAMIDFAEENIERRLFKESFTYAHSAGDKNYHWSSFLIKSKELLEVIRIVKITWKSFCND